MLSMNLCENSNVETLLQLAQTIKKQIKVLLTNKKNEFNTVVQRNRNRNLRNLHESIKYHGEFMDERK